MSGDSEASLSGAGHDASEVSGGAIGRGQPAIVVSVPADASAEEIEAFDALLRAAKPASKVSKEDTFKTWLG